MVKGGKNAMTIALIADVHLGAMNATTQRLELSEVFFHDLYNLDSLDMIVILGDLYDKKVYLNDETTSTAIWFYQELMKVARKKDAIVRIIYGTKSHEADQYNLLQQIEQTGVDIRVIYTAEKEEFFNGKMKFLYLPEEHIYSKKEYYKELLYDVGEPYQYIFGHGIINDIMKSDKSLTEESKENRLHVPSFTVGEFKSCCDGCVFFGHYHIHSSFKDFVHYVGSFSRWKFGEEEPKGYMISKHKIGAKKYSNTFVENTLAEKYHTIYYGYDHKIFKNENFLLEEFDKLENLVDTCVFDKIRCIIHIPETLENPDFYANAFRERFRFNEDIKFDFGEGHTEKSRVVDKEKAKEIYEEYGYITDQSANIEVVTSTFLEQEQHRIIPPERIRVYMDAKSIEELL